MEPIINPWIFYLLSIADGFKMLFTISAIFLIVFGIIFSAFAEDNKEQLSIFKKIITIGIVCIPLAILCPSKETIEEMVVSSYITPANYEAGKEEVMEIVDYIFEKMDEGKEEK